MAKITRLKLFQKPIKAYTDAYKEKSRKDEQFKVSAEQKEMKKLKDSDLEVAVNKKIPELKQLSTNKVQRMAIWSKLVCVNENKKHSGGSSRDVDVEEVSVIPVIPAAVKDSSQSTS